MKTKTYLKIQFLWNFITPEEGRQKRDSMEENSLKQREIILDKIRAARK